MGEPHGPQSPEPGLAAAVADAAEALVSIWDAANDRAVSRLSGSQLRALLFVERADGVNLRGLAAGLGMILSSASRLCDRLVAAGVLARETGLADRREIALRVTPSGRALLRELRAARRARLATALAGMSPAGRTALLRGLQEFAAASRGDGGQPASRVVADRPDHRAGRADHRGVAAEQRRAYRHG